MNNRLPATENEDQPGPMGVFQMSFGGEAFQSSLSETPNSFPSREAPRKLGQTAEESLTAGSFDSGLASNFLLDRLFK